jgi:hypothetical protein
VIDQDDRFILIAPLARSITAINDKDGLVTCQT